MIERLRRAKRFLRAVLTVDLGPADAVVLVAGMGRSGTTWLAQLISHGCRYRIVFEPFWNFMPAEGRLLSYLQSVPQHLDDSALRDRARRILAGRGMKYWTNYHSKGLIHRRRIVKSIRVNLMLGWLKREFPGLRIVLAIRHPLAVADSWLDLGWLEQGPDDRYEHEAFSAQTHLLDKFPAIAKALAVIDAKSLFERTIFAWGVSHYVPLRQLRGSDASVVFYENLVLDPETELGPVFQALDQDPDWAKIRTLLDKPSTTNYRQRSHGGDKKAMLSSWRDRFTCGEKRRAEEILEGFGLHDLYDAAGMPARAGHLLIS